MKYYSDDIISSSQIIVQYMAKETSRSTGKAQAALVFNDVTPWMEIVRDAIPFLYWEAISNQRRFSSGHIISTSLLRLKNAHQPPGGKREPSTNPKNIV
ncbi:hypothetical protein Bca4012_083452 [Brassica carinata]